MHIYVRYRHLCNQRNNLSVEKEKTSLMHTHDFIFCPNSLKLGLGSVSISA